MSWEVVERMTIYHEEGMYALAPNVVRTPSGDLMVFFQRAPHLDYPHHDNPLSNLQACRSQDEGQTWSRPSLVTSDPLGGINDRGVHTLSDGSIFIHCSCTELVPAEGLAGSFELFANEGLEALAGLRPGLVSELEKLPGEIKIITQ